MNNYQTARDAFRASKLGDVSEKLLTQHHDGSPYAYLVIRRDCSRDDLVRYLEPFAALALDHDGYLTMLRLSDGSVHLQIGVSGPAEAITYAIDEIPAHRAASDEVRKA